MRRKGFYHSRVPALLIGMVAGGLMLTCGQTSGQAPRLVSEAAEEVAEAVSPAPAFAQSKDASGQSVTVADVAERVVPSVVNISATKLLKQRSSPFSHFHRDPLFREFFGHPFEGIPRERRQRSLGSGVIVSSDGIVLTNSHVIEHAESVEVSLSDGRELDAEVLGTDPKSDLAVLKLQGKIEGLEPLPFGDSSSLRLGEVVLAIGNPFGVGQTVTMGIVSATGRGNVGIVDYEDFIQTDAAINPGNSGGALVNMRGELVGVNTAILSRTGGYQGVGFAIPSNLARPVMEGLVKNGRVVRGFLGVTIQELDDELAAGLGIDVERGVLVSGVGEGTPAEKAGFERGDVIVEMDGREMRSTSKLRNRVAMAGPGTKTKFVVLRGKKRLTLKATLGELPAKLARAGAGAAPQSGGALAGATFGDLTPERRQRYDIPGAVEGGAVVTEVEPGTPAARAGLRPGDVILELNRQRLGSASALRRALKTADGTLLLLVQRKSSTVYVALRP